MLVHPKIVIVENDSEFATYLKNEMEKHHYQVVISKNKFEAQRLVRSEQADLIILGTISPRGDAFHLHQWLKRSADHCTIPLIVIDTFPEMQLTKGWTKDEGLRLDAEEYFCRPIEAAALIPFINKLVTRSTERIKILVADDYALVREGIRVLLSLQDDMEVIGEACDGKEAIVKTRKLLPDIVLMDIVMPRMSGLEATRKICKECKNTKVLMLTQYYNQEYITASQQAGALGIIPKGSTSTRLISSIRTVSKGEKLITTEI